MKKIVLANIGNRNLTYSKQIIPNPRPDQPGESFRQRTQVMLTQYDTIEPELDEQILSVLLHDIGIELIEKVVLFASDNQIVHDRNNQDTLFEAQILQKLFAARLGLSVDIITYTRNVTHNDELLQFYRDVLRGYQASPQPIVICDAGGTPQQKAALKIAAEYLLNPEKYQVLYVDNGRVMPVEQVEYRRIIDEEQVIALIEHGQYAGALYVYEQLDNSVKKPDVLALLRFLNYRAELFYADAQKEITITLKEKSVLLANFLGGKSAGVWEPFNACFSTKGFRALCERLEIAHYRYQLGDWSRAALGISIFIESLVNEAIQQQGRFKLVGEYEKGASQLKTEVIENPDYTYLLAYFDGADKIRSGLPLHLKFLEQTTSSSELSKILNLFMPLNSRTNQSEGKLGLDCLRNRLAHKGESVKEDDLRRHTPTISEVFNETRKLLGLPEENSYKILNNILVSLLRS